MLEFLIPLLTFLAITALGGAFLSARLAAQEPMRTRLSELQRSRPNDIATSAWPMRLLAALSGLTSAKGPSDNLRAELASAGFHGRNAASVYMGSKLVLLLSGVVGLTAALLPVETWPLGVRGLMVLWGGGILFFIPNFVVRQRREARQADIRRAVPDAIDLLEVCVSSGMGLDAAWNAVADEIRSVNPILADELALTDLEIHLGAPRATAMRHMAARTGVAEIASLVGVLVQAERFGTSVADSLKTFAASMRELRSQRAEESAEKMPIKLLFPLVLLMFPAVLIVIAGPAGIQWAEIIAGGY